MEEAWKIWDRLIESMILAEDDLSSMLTSGLDLNNNILQSNGFYGESSIFDTIQLCIDTLTQVCIALIPPPTPLFYGQMVECSHVAKVAAYCVYDLKSAVEYEVKNNYDIEQLAILSLSINYYAGLMIDLRSEILVQNKKNPSSSNTGIPSIFSNINIQRGLLDQFVNAADPVYADVAFARQNTLTNELLETWFGRQTSVRDLTDNDINLLLVRLYDRFIVLKSEYTQYEFKTEQIERSAQKSRVDMIPSRMLLATTAVPTSERESSSPVEIIGRQRMKKFKQPIIEKDYDSLYSILISAFQLSNLVSDINNAMLAVERIQNAENEVALAGTGSDDGHEEDGFTFEAPYNQLKRNILYELFYVEQIFRHTKYVVARFFKHPSGILSSYDEVMHSCVVALTLTRKLLLAMAVTKSYPAYPQEEIDQMDIEGQNVLYILSYLNIIANQVHVRRLDPKAKFLNAIINSNKTHPDIVPSDATVSLVKSFIGRDDKNDDKLANRSNELITLTLRDYQANSSALIGLHYSDNETSPLVGTSPSNLRRIIFTGRSIASSALRRSVSALSAGGSVASSAVRRSVNALSKLPLARPLLVVGLDAATGELGASTVGSVASSFASPIVSRISSNPMVGFLAPPALSLAANYAFTGSLNTGTMVNTVLSLFVPAAKWAYGKATAKKVSKKKSSE